MASVEFQKTDTQWLIFADLYQYCQKFWIPEDNKQYWQDLVDATDALEEKYKGVEEQIEEFGKIADSFEIGKRLGQDDAFQQELFDELGITELMKNVE